MTIHLSFYGAARNVTGSAYLLDTGQTRILVDCGMYQEREMRDRNWDPFPVTPASIDTVLLTHAHLDHCGLLPKLVRDGFAGRVVCTAATADIARIVMLDAGHIQEEDAEFKRRRHEREGRHGPRPELPLYTVQDAQNVLPRFQTVPYEKSVQVGEDLRVSFHEGGHILGSGCVRVEVSQNGETRSILFSGDIGRWDTPILRDPEPPAGADYVVMESTYGDRNHGERESIPEELAGIVNATRHAGGNLIIPSFAVERAQELLYHLGELLREDRVPHLRVFVDSPMAVRVTEVFSRHPDLFDEETLALLERGEHPCDFPGLTMCSTVAESKSINHIKGTAIVIAGSGMCTGGRIKHHLAHNISNPASTVLFVGYQAAGTLGRIILEGTDRVRIHGQMQPVRASVRRINGFSAHADRDELLRWLSVQDRVPRRVFVTHGESKSARAFADTVQEQTGLETYVPSYKERVELA